MAPDIFENNNTHKPLVSGPNPLVATFHFDSLLILLTTRRTSGRHQVFFGLTMSQLQFPFFLASDILAIMVEVPLFTLKSTIISCSV